MGAKKMNESHEFQRESAAHLAEWICGDESALEELDADFLLDIMGILGLSFVKSDAASQAFIASLR